MGCAEAIQTWVVYFCTFRETTSVVPNVWAMKGQKMGRAEAIQTWGVYFQSYHCLSLSVYCVGTKGGQSYYF